MKANDSVYSVGDHRGREPQSGLTARDYIAIQAMKSVSEWYYPNQYDKIVESSYALADAMIKQSEVK